MEGVHKRLENMQRRGSISKLVQAGMTMEEAEKLCSSSFLSVAIPPSDPSPTKKPAPNRGASTPSSRRLYPRKQSISQIQDSPSSQRSPAFSSSPQKAQSFVSPSQSGDTESIIAQIIQSPRNQIAAELHKRDSAIASLKRNIQHLTRKSKDAESELSSLRLSASSLESLNESLRTRLSSSPPGAASTLTARKVSMFAARKAPQPSFNQSPVSLNQVSKEEHDKALERMEVLSRKVDDQLTQMKLSASNN
ncbi:hypothetical protein TrRE_jg3180, partial [Triparma retinervis]